MPASRVVHARADTAGARPDSTRRRQVERLWGRRHDPRFRLEFVLVALFVVAAVAFAHVVEDYLDHEALVRWDVRFSRYLHVHENSTLVSLFDVLTWGGNVIFLAALSAVVVLLLVRSRRFNDAALVAVGALGIELLNGGLKLLFKRPRPELSYVHLDTYSFPSGHAAGTSAIYALVLYVLARRASNSIRVSLAALYVVAVSVVGFSRLYLEAHYLSDVLAGTALGCAFAAAALFLYETRRDRLDVHAALPAPARRVVDRIAR